MSERHYSRDEMQAILARAIERQVRGSGDAELSHAQLMETAREVGLSPADIEAAIADVQTRQTRELAIAFIRDRRQRRLRAHAVAYVAVNAGLWAIDAVTAAMASSTQAGWHWIVAAAWGVALGLHAWSTWNPHPQDLARAAERMQARQARRQQQRQMQRAIEGAVTDVVTTGADALTRLLDADRQRRRDRDRKP